MTTQLLSRALGAVGAMLVATTAHAVTIRVDFTANNFPDSAFPPEPSPQSSISGSLVYQAAAGTTYPATGLVSVDLTIGTKTYTLGDVGYTNLPGVIIFGGISAFPWDTPQALQGLTHDFMLTTNPLAPAGAYASNFSYAQGWPGPDGSWITTSFPQYTMTPDAEPPDTSITASPAALSTSDAASFTFTGSDDVAGVASYECSLDGAAYVACSSPQSYTGLAEGPHIFAVRAIDKDGNVDPSPATHAWTIDLNPPDTSITSTPASPTNATSASFAFTGSDTGSGVASFECQLDGGSFAPCTSPASFSGLVDGPHTFQVRALDGVGNADPTPASHSWTIETVAPPPPVVVSPPDQGVVQDPQPAISGNAEPGSTVRIYIDGAMVGETTADGAGTWNFTPPSPLSPGSHTLRIRAVDGVGNESPLSAPVTLVVAGAPAAVSAVPLLGLPGLGLLVAAMLGLAGRARRRA